MLKCVMPSASGNGRKKASSSSRCRCWKDIPKHNDKQKIFCNGFLDEEDDDDGWIGL